MTKFNIKTSSSAYLRDKDVFISELRHFHEVRGSTIRHIPNVNGKEVDLYHLYLLVTHHGGWSKVNNQGLWDSLLKPLGLPTPCVNGGVGIRQIYLRYLERWERLRGSASGGGSGGGAGGGGGDLDGGADDGDEDRPRRAAWGPPKLRNTVPHTYNYNQHNITDNVRESIGLTPLQKYGGSSEKLALSLLSPLPNEQDFALNVCTILAADVNNKLPVNTTPHIIDFLLGHAAVYNHASLRDVIGKSYMDARKMSVELYWVEHVKPAGTLELLDERRFPIHGLAMRAIMSQLHLNTCLISGEIPVDDKDVLVSEELSTCLDSEDGVIGKKCHGGARDVISRRVTQVGTIMRNLSFHDDNLSMLAKHQTYIRFLLLCVNSSQSSVRQMGLDALGNIAQELHIKDPATCLLSRHLLSTLTTCLYSEDRAKILASLEVLNKLSQNENNEDVLLRCLEQKIYEHVCSYLTLHDIMLLVVTLECVYSLTSLGEKACDFIVKVHGVVDTLVSLITVEAQSYGPKACILMRVVETVPGGAPNNAIHAPSPPPVIQHNIPNQMSQNTLHQMQNQAPPQLVQIHNTTQPQMQNCPPSGNPSFNQPVKVEVNPTSPVSSAQQQMSIQQQHAHQQAIQVLNENEQFALAWLRSTWEPCAPNIRLDAGEIYKQYIACCQKVGRKGVISPLHFPRCVRSVFGGMVGPNPVKTVSGDTQQCYMGIKMRQSAINKAQSMAASAPINVKTGPSSPILKAQLSKLEQNKLTSHPNLIQVLNDTPASPPPSAPPPAPNTPQQPAAPSPSPSVGSNQTSQGNQSNTSLIKHLLAHKVSGAPAPGNAPDRMAVQVTQRQAQNQQRMMGQTTNPSAAHVSSPGVPMEVDAEALISCSTITAAGVTSTSPLPAGNSKQTAVMPSLAPLSKNVTMVKQEELSEGFVIESQAQESIAVDEQNLHNSNKMLTDLLEKQSSPPMVMSVRAEDRKMSSEESEEPPSKIQKTESVSSKAANLYAALAADTLEDEEDLLIEGSSDQVIQIVQPGQVIQPSPIIQGGQIVHSGQPLQQPNQQVLQTQIVPQGGQVSQQGGQIVKSNPQIAQQTNQLIQQGGQIVSQGSQIIQQGGQIVSQGSQIIQQGGQIVSQGSQIIQQGGQIVTQGPQIIQQGGQIVSQGQQIIQQGGQIVTQGPQIIQQGGQIVTQGPQMIQQSGQIVSQGAQIIQQGGQVLTQGVHVVQQNRPNISQSPQIVQGGQMIQQGSIIQQNGQVIQAGSQIIQQGQMVQSGQVIQQSNQMVQQNSTQIVHQTGQVLPQSGQLIQQGNQMVQQIVQQGQVMQQAPEGQIMVPAITNQSGQLILHGLGFVPGGVVPHKTIIILQSGNGPNSPMTLTVNNAGGLDENTLNSLISQATEAISMQQKQAQSGNTIIQNPGQIIQSSSGVIQGSPTIIQSSPGLIQQGGIIKQQIIQGQTLVSNQQAIISHQPQPQMIANSQLMQNQGQPHQMTGAQQVVMTPTTNANQQMGQVVGNSQQILVGNQQVVVGNQQIVVSNQPMISSSTTQAQHQQTQSHGLQSSGNQYVVDPHRQNIASSAPPKQDKKPLPTNVPQAFQPQKMAAPNQQNVPINKNIPPTNLVETKPQPKKMMDEPWICQWRNCDMAFENAAAVYSHACAIHCNREELPCLWAHCDQLPRKKFSLMTHLQDRHCSTEALKSAHAQRRKGIVPTATPPAASQSSTTALSNSSADTLECEGQNNSNQPVTNAALHAIKRHAVDFLNPRELMDDNEGPVTKSIRLTAALILRNIVIYSHIGKRLLRGYEPHLASIALSTVEASRTVAQILYDMNC